jgi:hypothetical protein
MNADTNITHTTKPAVARGGTRKSEPGASRPRETCKTTGARRARQTTAGKSRPTQTEPAAEEFTVVEARIDVGLGNALFIRGQGDGLNWDQGQPLACVKNPGASSGALTV